MSELINNLLEQVNTNQFLSGGLVLGAITSIIYSLKSIPMRIWTAIRRRIMFEVTIEQQDELFGFLQFWINKNRTKELRNVKAVFYRNKEATYNESTSDKKGIKEEGVTFHSYGDYFTIFYKNRLITISSNKEKFENANNVSFLFFEKYIITGLLAKKAIMGLLKEATQVALEYEKSRIKPAVRYNEYSGWSETSDIILRNLGSIFIPVDKKKFITDDLDDFVKNKSFYIKRNIPYRRGYLFDGPPGTGKSSLASAIANHYKRDLYIMNLKSIESDSAFERLMMGVRPNSVLLYEDIDSYFSGRKAKTKVSFSTFINTLSGVKSKTDVIVIVTTNHKSELDDALMRAGRLDVHVTIDLPTQTEINQYLSWFYERDVNIELGLGLSMAEIENICCQNKENYENCLKQLYETQEA